MGFRDHGYYGFAFVGARPLQIVSLIAVVGMVGNLISQDSHAHLASQSQLVGTLVISCLALLWSLISVTAYDDTHVPYIATGTLDILFSIPFIVVAAVFGGPLSAITCSSYPTSSDGLSSDILTLVVSQDSSILLAGNNRSTCNQIMAAWGFIIALCVLFALSGLAIGLLFLGKRRAAAAAAKDLSISSSESQIELATAPAKEAVFDVEASAVRSQ